MIDLSYHRAVVTGAGSGIGRAIAMVLAAQGCIVAAVDRDRDSALETAESIASAGHRATPFTTDVTSTVDVREMREELVESIGPPSIIVNNVGWDQLMPFTETTPDLWARVIDANLVSTINVTHAFFDDLIEAPGAAHIVNIASEAARVGSRGEALYSASKGGVIGFTKAIAREGAPHGVNANCVCPGLTDTPLLRAQPASAVDARVRAVPMKRLADPREIAYAVAFLASDHASYITGQVLSVSGGLTMVG